MNMPDLREKLKGLLRWATHGAGEMMPQGGTDALDLALTLRESLSTLDRLEKLAVLGRGGEKDCRHETVTRRESGHYGCVKCNEGFMSRNDAQVLLGGVEIDCHRTASRLSALVSWLLKHKVRGWESTQQNSEATT